MIMENFVALVVMVASLSVAGLLIMKNFRTKSLAGKKSRIVSILLLLNSCLLLCDMAAGKGVAFRLPLDLLLSLFALYPVMSSVLREKASVLLSVWRLQRRPDLPFIMCFVPCQSLDCLPRRSLCAWQLWLPHL